MKFVVTETEKSDQAAEKICGIQNSWSVCVLLSLSSQTSRPLWHRTVIPTIALHSIVSLRVCTNTEVRKRSCADVVLIRLSRSYSSRMNDAVWSAIMSSYCRLSVRMSVCLWRCALLLNDTSYSKSVYAAHNFVRWASSQQQLTFLLLFSPRGINKKNSYCWKAADRTTLSGIALLHADDGYSRCVNLNGFRLFALWSIVWINLFVRLHQRVYDSRGGSLRG